MRRFQRACTDTDDARTQDTQGGKHVHRKIQNSQLKPAEVGCSAHPGSGKNDDHEEEIRQHQLGDRAED